MAEKDKITVSRDALKEVVGIIEESRAIQTLEYHDKNRLSGSNESRSRAQIELLTDALNKLFDIGIR